MIAKNIPQDFPGITMETVACSIIVKHKGDAFVDDSQMGCTGNLRHNAKDSAITRGYCQRRHVLQGLHKLAQKWECVLFTTGGALNLQKSFWILLTWCWSNGIGWLNTLAKDQAQLHLTEGYGTVPHPIPRKCPYNGFRTLGAYISPCGLTDLARKKLHHIALQYATSITGSTLDRTVALWSYILYLIPKLTFSKPALTLTKEEGDKLQSPAIMALLPKLHLNCHTARELVFGPDLYGGLELLTIYGQQSYGQITYLLGHVNFNDKTGKLILVSLSYLQLLSGSDRFSHGLNGDCMSQMHGCPFAHVHTIMPCWITLRV
jgi:hypothetical protein